MKQRIIIDDRLPVAANLKPAFAHCADPREQWVALIEKAYAKLYGCYEAIEAGKVGLNMCALLRYVPNLHITGAPRANGPDGRVRRGDSD